jgi:hypothetical protein
MFSSNSLRKQNVLNVENQLLIDVQDAKINGTVLEIVKSGNGKVISLYVISYTKTYKKIRKDQKKSRANKNKPSKSRSQLRKEQ